MRRITIFCWAQALLIFLFLKPVWAQNSDQTIAALEQEIKELQQCDRELEERIRALETNQRPASPEASSDLLVSTIASPAPPPLSPDAQDSTQSSPSMPAEMHSLRGIQWRGFAEVDYKVLNQSVPELGIYGFVPGSAGDFFTGDFDLFLTHRLTDHMSLLADVDFEEIDSQQFRIDLRRMLFKYDANDHLHLSLGRYQISNGYYNWAFPSATFLQTTADRPLLMEFANDGGPLPTQAVGISATGAIPSGHLGLHYVAEYGSSDTMRPYITGTGLFLDENNGNHTNVGIFITPDFVPELRIGASFYRDQISDLIALSLGGEDIGTEGVDGYVPSETARWNQTIVNGHVVYVTPKIEFLNEGFLIRQASIGPGETYDTPAFYSQLSRKFGHIRPFFRYQYFNASQQNVFYNDIGLRYGPSFGARYDFNEFWDFKAQLDHTIRRDLPNLSGLHLQLSGTF
jgi:hypothetical protein